MTSTRPEDRELEALLREQALLPVPLALVGRILDEVLPAEPVRPWALAGRAAAVVLVFCASWLAFSGGVPAFADVAPQPRVAAALPADLALAPASAAAVLEATTAAPAGDATAWLGAGMLVFLVGLGCAVRLHAGGTGAKGGAA